MNTLVVRLMLITAVLGVLGLIAWGTWAGTRFVAHGIALMHCSQGDAKRTIGNLDGALLDYNRALVFDSKLARAYYGRALVESAKGKYDKP